MKSRLLSAVAVLMLAGASGLVSNTPATAAKTYTGCVKKSTGEMRILLGKTKTCTKGWKKRTWTKSGPKGPAGATGPSTPLSNVVDANSAVVGQYLGYLPIGGFGLGVLFVRFDGGMYKFDVSGLLIPSPSITMKYDNAACSGDPFLVSAQAEARDSVLQDPSFRMVYRTTSPGIGPSLAYKARGTSDSISGLPTWSKSSSGVCTAGAAQTGFRIPLTPVMAPPDHPGPLRIA